MQGPVCERPTPNAQELSAATILSGKSAVLAAETGSGKTMAYLAPLISALLSEREAERQAPAEQHSSAARC